MIMYKQVPTLPIGVTLNVVNRLSDGAFIPFDLANNDYVDFKKEINDEAAELQDADGNTMSAAEAKEFVATLP